MLRLTLILVYIVTVYINLHAQDFLFQGWYWDYPKTSDGENWADTLRLKAAELSDAGFTFVWLPPLSRTSSGSNSNGYDPKDLYDLGEFGLGPTGFGSRTDVDNLVAEFNAQGIKAVADVVFNHRDGGKAENNPAVEDWIENFTYPGNCPYPSDRVRFILPIGGTTGKGSGTYYFKIKSKTEHPDFFGKSYKFYVWTTKVGWQGLPDETESEPNGGGGCGEPNNTVSLGVNYWATIDASGCKIDEFQLTLSASDFYSAGDTLFCVLPNDAGYSDHYIYELWYNDGVNPTVNIQSDVIYQTYTDFTSLPSGRGGMNWQNFKPNGVTSTTLCGDWDWPWFFYDYDQYIQSTKDTLFAWTAWLWNDVGIRGLRMDAVKHFTPEFVGDLFDYLYDQGIAPQLNVGEYFDGNSATLKNWIDQVYSYMDADTKSAITPRVFDFSLFYALKDASDTYGYDVRNVFNSGLVDAQGMSGFNVVTFVNNHDLAKEGNNIQNDPVLAYAYILTNNQAGLPTVFYPDYYYVNGFTNTGMKDKIDKLIGLHKKYIYGASARDYLSRIGTPYNQNFTSGYDNTTLIYQLMNIPTSQDVIVAINYAGGTDTLKVSQEINTTNVTSGDVFVNMIDNNFSTYAKVNSGNEILIELPPRSYSVWVQGVLAEIKIYLEGPYDSNSNEMKTALASNNYLPLTSPYTEDPRTVKNIPANTVDWILIELRSGENGPAVAYRSAFLRKDGRIVDDDGTGTAVPIPAKTGNYYIVVKHRNHLPVMSAAPVGLSGSNALYDFTTSQSQAYGANPLTDLTGSGIYGMIAGDATNNGSVDAADRNETWNKRNQTGYLSADVTCNGVVDAADRNITWNNRNKVTQVP